MIGIFTYDFFPIKGGQGTHLFNIYKNFLKLWFKKFKIFSPCCNNINESINIFSKTDNSFLGNIGLSFFVHKNIKKLIEKYDLKILNFHWWPWWLFFLRKVNIPVIFTCHHTYWQQYNYVKWQKRKKIFYYLEKLSYKKADKIICVSEDTKNILKEKYGISEKKLVYIPNGINLEEFKVDEKIKKEKNSLVFVWRLDERKWILFLVEAMKWIVKKNREIKLYVVWWWKLQKKLQDFVENNKLEENVFILGRLSMEDLLARVQKSEIMIVPSVFEWFGISVLEWMACRVAVIGTNSDGIRTIIKDGKNGLLVNYGDKEKLRESINELLDNNLLRNKIVDNAYNSLEKKYNWNLIAKKTIGEYEKLV